MIKSTTILEDLQGYLVLALIPESKIAEAYVPVAQALQIAGENGGSTRCTATINFGKLDSAVLDKRYEVIGFRYSCTSGTGTYYEQSSNNLSKVFQGFTMRGNASDNNQQEHIKQFYSLGVDFVFLTIETVQTGNVFSPFKTKVQLDRTSLLHFKNKQEKKPNLSFNRNADDLAGDAFNDKVLDEIIELVKDHTDSLPVEFTYYRPQ